MRTFLLVAFKLASWQLAATTWILDNRALFSLTYYPRPRHNEPNFMEEAEPTGKVGSGLGFVLTGSWVTRVSGFVGNDLVPWEVLPAA